MYPTFAKEAREEGFTKIAALFELVAKIEKEHMERYETLKANVDNGTVFKKQESVTWICLNCGHVYEGAQPPQVAQSAKSRRAGSRSRRKIIKRTLSARTAAGPGLSMQSGVGCHNTVLMSFIRRNRR